MAEKYILRITAGAGYEEDAHVEVRVNEPVPIIISSAAADIELCVRIQDYAGLPRGSLPTSPYFDAEPHAYNQDRYSIAFRFTPKAPPPRPGETGKTAGPGAEEEAAQHDRGIKGTDLLFGNDFDRPIRDRLPPGFNTAMSIVRWWIDPGLDGDAYADKPYLYGPALSSFNVLHLGKGEYDETRGGLCFDEGGDEAGLQARRLAGAPDDSKARMKWALKDDAKAKWFFEYGRTYALDFFNPYLDFSSLALRLPGFHLPIIKYWDGQALRRSHHLRYVLRNKSTDEVYLVVVFTIHLKEDVNEDGTIKHGGVEGAAAGDEHQNWDMTDRHDEEQALRAARDQLGSTTNEVTSADDID